MAKKSEYRKDGRMDMLKRAALADEIEIRPNGWGLNTAIGTQGEWISYDIIKEWEKQGLLTIKDDVGTITEKGRRLEYVE